MSKIYQDKEWLYQNYIIEERPATEMAQMAGCHFPRSTTGSAGTKYRSAISLYPKSWLTKILRRERPGRNRRQSYGPTLSIAITKCKCGAVRSFTPNSLRSFAVYGKILNTVKVTVTQCAPYGKILNIVARCFLLYWLVGIILSTCPPTKTGWQNCGEIANTDE